MNLDEQKNAVLVDNTAQAVFKHLDRIRDSRASLGTRWIWELLQNARDVASEVGVAVSIDVTASHLIFRHDGKPFRIEDVTHLIYHGSTKIDLEGAVGRYGSGFLSTHLLSPIVRLCGSLDDGRRFDFRIDRSGSDVHALSERMEKSWEAFKISIDGSDSFPSASTAEFEYPLDLDARELAAEGIEQLRICASLVLAFAPELASISVSTHDASWSVARGERTKLSDAVSLLRIESLVSGQTIARFVALARNSDSTVAALPLEAVNGEMRVSLTPLVPRLYVLFPMVTTERLSLPVAISSFKFKPREDRDGISLKGDTEGPTENRQILAEAVEQISELLVCASTHRWEGVERLLAFDTSILPDWVDRDWYSELMRELLEIVRKTPLILVEGNQLIPPKDALIPFGSNEEQCLAVANFAVGLRSINFKLPRSDLIVTWSTNLMNWAELLSTTADEMPEALTLEGVARHVTEARSLDELRERLSVEVSPIEWLGGLVQYIRDAGSGDLFDELSLLPAQSGHLRRRSELQFDPGVDEEVKNLGVELGFDLRARLLDGCINAPHLAHLLSEMTEADALREVIKHLKAECHDDRISLRMVDPTVRLLGWIGARSKYEDHLWGFPMPTADDDGESVLTYELSQHVDVDDRPIAPSAYWPSELQPFVSLFPRRRMMNEAFVRADLLADSCDQLAITDLFHRSPVYTVERKPTDLLPDSEMLEDGIAHEAIESVTQSDIAHLSGDDYAILDTIRKSPSRALEFVRFISELANKSDPDPFQTLPVQCVCGESHQAYRAAWLEPTRARTWVPGGSDARRTAKVSAESLAELVGGAPDLVGILAQERGGKLLEALAISPADFMLRVVAKDENARVSLIRSMGDLAQAAGGDPDRVRRLVNQIREHPEIIDEIDRQNAQRDRVKRNQEIGGLIEDLLRIALVSEGLSVERTGVGSDFEVDCDLIEQGQEVVLNVAQGKSSTLVEMKATHGDGAKMTPRQAETARSHGKRFALCVVHLDDVEPTMDLVRDRCRFMFGIGDRLQSVWAQYESIQRATTAAKAQAGPIVIDVIEGQYRFMIRREVWESGLTFDQAIARFRDHD